MIESQASPDVIRQGILVDLLSLLVQLRRPDEVWTEAVHKMKWLLEFDRVDLALLDASEATYSLKTLFESRPRVPLCQADRVPREKGSVGRLGEAAAVVLQDLPAAEIVDPGLEGGSLSRILVVRLRAQDRSLGALCFGSRMPDAYGHAETELATILADHLSVVFARIQDFRRVMEDLEGFSYSVAHDLRAPLRSIHQYAEWLLEEESRSLSDQGRESLRRIIGAAGQMDRLINGLLAYSHLGRSDVPIGPVSLRKAVAAALEELKTQSAGLQARITLEGDLGEVLGNELLLQQVLLNLLSNALKFVAPASPPVIRIRAERRDRRLRLWVEDEGIGIAPDESRRLFLVFERLHRVERFPGTGIGLAIVRRAVERMGGSVGLESEPGRGSRFWFELEAATAPKPASQNG